MDFTPPAKPPVSAADKVLMSGTTISNTLPHAKQKSLAAFTLIELSIVLVIIGLIAGGILAGKAMLDAARIRAGVSQFTEFQIGIQHFKYKYNCLPGDCTSASQLFGGGAINGNGNYIIGWYAPAHLDNPKAWQHLSLSGLIRGQYTGVIPDTGYAGFNIGVNMPQNDLQPGDSWMFHRHSASLNGEKNRIAFVGSNSSSIGIAAKTMLAFDSKIDDGKPLLGKVFSSYQNTYYCQSVYTIPADKSTWNTVIYRDDSSPCGVLLDIVE